MTGQGSYVNGRALLLRHAAATVRSYEGPLRNEHDLKRFKRDGNQYVGPSLVVQVLEFLMRPKQEEVAARSWCFVCDAPVEDCTDKDPRTGQRPTHGAQVRVLAMLSVLYIHAGD